MIPHKSNRILVVVAICCVSDKGSEYRQTISGNCGDYSMVGGSELATLIWRVAIWCFFSVLKLTPAKPWYISIQLNCLLNCDESNRWKSTYAFGKTAHTKKTSERWMEENGKCTIICIQLKTVLFDETQLIFFSSGTLRTRLLAKHLSYARFSFGNFRFSIKLPQTLDLQLRPVYAYTHSYNI